MKREFLELQDVLNNALIHTPEYRLYDLISNILMRDFNFKRWSYIKEEYLENTLFVNNEMRLLISFKIEKIEDKYIYKITAYDRYNTDTYTVSIKSLFELRKIGK